MTLKVKTSISTFIFTADIPDIEISSDLEAVVMETTVDDEVIFSVTLYIDENGDATMRDIRGVIEQYMRDEGISYENFLITAYSTDRVAHNPVCEFTAIYLPQHYDGNVREFLQSNFLTTLQAKLTTKASLETLSFVKFYQEEITAKWNLITDTSDGEKVETFSTVIDTPDEAGVQTISVSYAELLTHCADPLNTKLLAYSIYIGSRAFTFYVAPSEPEVQFYFRNAFNAWELCSLHGITTGKTEVSRSVAISNLRSSFYDQSTEKKFEVQTSPIPRQQARWIDQLFFSHDVRMTDASASSIEEMPVILITESTCEIQDSDEEMNTVKFTWEYDDRRTYLNGEYLQTVHKRVHQNPYHPTFN